MEIRLSNKTISCITIFLSASFFASNVLANTVTVPNSFVSGQTAVAAEVNGNFTALKDAINDNASKIIVVKDGNATTIGTYIYGSHLFYILSPKKYIFTVTATDGYLYNTFAYYTSNDCTGIAYDNGPQKVIYNEPNYLYVPKGSLPTTITANSYGTIQSCSNINATLDLYQTYSNDPAITGVPSASVTLPLTLDTE